MPLTRPRKPEKKQHLWHYEDPQCGGPFCKRPKYGDFYPDSHWPTTRNPKAVTCPKCLERMKKEGILKDEDEE